MISRRGFLAATSLLAAGGCRVLPSPLAGTFKVGFVAPFSGRDSVVGYNALLGLKLALQRLNDVGGLAPGWRVELVAHDDSATAEGGRTQARKLLVDPDVVAVVGHPTNASAMAAVDLYREAEMPFITLATAQSLTRGEGVFRMGPSDTALVDLLLDILPARFRAERISIVTDDATQAQFADLMETRWKAAGGTVTARDQIPAETTFFEAPALRALAQSPQAVVYSGGIEMGAPLYAEIRRLAPGLPVFLTPSAANPHFIRLSGSPTDAAYAIFGTSEPSETPAAFDFVRAYRAAWGQDPLPQAVLSYDCALLVLAAIERSIGTDGTGSPSRAGTMAGLAGGATGGLSGELQFDSANERPHELYVYRLASTRYPGERQEFS